MKIVRAHTGATAVPVPDRDVILVDPEIGHNTAVNAIRAVLPAAHPDAVEHWVEVAIPTATTSLDTHLAKQCNVKRRKRRRKRIEKASRVMVRLSALALAAVAGGFTVYTAHATENPTDNAVSTVLNGFIEPLHTHRAATPEAATWQAPQEPKPTPTATTVANPWRNATFVLMRDARGWRCVNSTTDALTATCTTVDNLAVHWEAWRGPGGVTHYTGSYTRRDRKQRVNLKVFPDNKAIRRFLDSINPMHFPNMVRKDNWVMYGSDGARIKSVLEAMSETGREQPSPKPTQSSRDYLDWFFRDRD